jgi:hypothetical protein
MASQPVRHTKPVAIQPAIHTAISADRRRISRRCRTVSGSR